MGGRAPGRRADRPRPRGSPCAAIGRVGDLDPRAMRGSGPSWRTVGVERGPTSITTSRIRGSRHGESRNESVPSTEHPSITQNRTPRPGPLVTGRRRGEIRRPTQERRCPTNAAGSARRSTQSPMPTGVVAESTITKEQSPRAGRSGWLPCRCSAAPRSPVDAALDDLEGSEHSARARWFAIGAIGNARAGSTSSG